MSNIDSASADIERKWEEVQMKAFTHWVNAVLERRAIKVDNLLETFSDGITIINFVELVCEKALKVKYRKDPSQRIYKIENTHLALDFLKTQGLEPKYLTISSEDFIDRNKKFILGFLWILFRKFRIAKDIGVDDVDSTTEGLLKMCRDITKGHEGVNIESFKKSFSDGNALLALLDAHDNTLFDYKERISEHSSIDNIEYAFKLAEKELGVPQLLDVHELYNGTIDERSVMLYISLCFHAFVSAEDKKKIEDEKKLYSEKITDLQSELELSIKRNENKDQELSALQRDLSTEEEHNSKLSTEINSLKSQTEDLKKQLADFKNAINSKIKDDSAHLESMCGVLSQHLKGMHDWSKYLEQEVEYEADSVCLKTESKIRGINIDDQIDYFSKTLSSEDAKLCKLEKEYQIEVAQETKK